MTVAKVSSEEHIASDNLHITAGLAIPDTHTKNQFPKKPKGLRQIRDHRWKALGEENPDLLCLFLSGPFLTSYFFKQVKTGSREK